MKNIKNIIFTLFIIFISVIILVYPDEIISASKDAVMRCLTTIIPSLFGFMVISDLFVSTGFYRVFSKPFSFISEKILKIPRELFPVLLISFIGGYPIGGIIITKLIKEKKITLKTAERMYLFCYSPSPVFVIALMREHFIPQCIYIAYFSIVAGNLILAFITSLFYESEYVTSGNEKICFSSEKLVKSVENASAALFRMCAVIVFFSVIISALDTTGVFSVFPEKYRYLVSSILEITNAGEIFGHFSNFAALTTALVSFGGVSVILQLVSLTEAKIPLIPFIVSRCLCAVLSYLICTIVMLLLDIPVTVLADISHTQISVRQISPIPSLFLIIMTILLLNKKNCCYLK